MHLIDTHCHLSFEELEKDIDNVLARSIAAGVKEWITVGTNIEHTEKAIALAQRFDNLYAAAGIHPHFAKDIAENDLAKLIELANNKKIVAIGETGLDFHYNFSKQAAQIELFEQQIKIAADLNLPQRNRRVKTPRSSLTRRATSTPAGVAMPKLSWTQSVKEKSLAYME